MNIKPQPPSWLLPQDEAGSLFDSDVPDATGSYAAMLPEGEGKGTAAPSLGNTTAVMSFKPLGGMFMRKHTLVDGRYW